MRGRLFQRGHLLMLALPCVHCSSSIEHVLPGVEAEGPDEVPVGTGGTRLVEGPGAGGMGGSFAPGGIAEVGTFRGYVFTEAAPASTIIPAEFTGGDLCASGRLGPAREEWAAIGWNIAQDIDPETFRGGEVRAISPGGTGLQFVVHNKGVSPLRLQIQSGPGGSETWCTGVPHEGSGVASWSDFTKECWIPGGERYDAATPISTILVTTHASSDVESTPFDFCVVFLGPI